MSTPELRAKKRMLDEIYEVFKTEDTTRRRIEELDEHVTRALLEVEEVKTNEKIFISTIEKKVEDTISEITKNAIETVEKTTTAIAEKVSEIERLTDSKLLEIQDNMHKKIKYLEELQERIKEVETTELKIKDIHEQMKISVNGKVYICYPEMIQQSDLLLAILTTEIPSVKDGDAYVIKMKNTYVQSVLDALYHVSITRNNVYLIDDLYDNEMKLAGFLHTWEYFLCKPKLNIAITDKNRKFYSNPRTGDMLLNYAQYFEYPNTSSIIGTHKNFTCISINILKLSNYINETFTLHMCDSHSSGNCYIVNCTYTGDQFIIQNLMYKPYQRKWIEKKYEIKYDADASEIRTTYPVIGLPILDDW